MAIYAHIQGLAAGSTVGQPFGADWFCIDNLGWSVHRETHALPHTGTAESKIGVGEPQELTISKEVDGLSTTLASKAIDGSTLGTVLIAVTEAGSMKCVLAYKLDNAFAQSWRVTTGSDGKSLEEISIGYRKIALAMLVAGQVQLCAWDHVFRAPWKEVARSFYVDPALGIRMR